MSNCLPSGAVHVRDIYLWAHVGVLESERLLGQSFNLSFSLWLDLENSSRDDDLSTTADYSLAISDLQQLAFRLNCLTIEHFSEHILNSLENLYGPIPMEVLLSKTSAPIPGFSGTVAVQRRRHFPSP